MLSWKSRFALIIVLLMTGIMSACEATDMSNRDLDNTQTINAQANHMVITTSSYVYSLVPFAERNGLNNEKAKQKLQFLYA